MKIIPKYNLWNRAILVANRLGAAKVLAASTLSAADFEPRNTPFMHRLPNSYSVTRFRAAAMLMLGKWLLLAVAAAVLGYSLWVADRDLTHLSIGLVVLAVPLTVGQWLFASRARCPLCIGHPLVRKGCMMHRNTRRLLGSYRLHVAMAVVFQGSFRCPYCGESTAIAVRRRHRR